MFKVILIIIFFPLALMSCSSKQEDKPAQDNAVASEKEENEYPDIVLRFPDGEQLQAKRLEGKNIFVFFQPDCDHCQHEAVEIEQRLDAFKDYNLYFISSSDMPQILKFAEDYKLDNREKVKFAWTSTESVLTYYGPIQTPSIYIYSAGKLVKSFNGQTDVENIIKSL